MGNYFRIEDLKVYTKLCDLHIEIGEIVKGWPSDERFELSSQIRRSSNSSPANLAEKHSDRHVKNKIEGVNRARGEALETLHHLYIAMRKGYVSQQTLDHFRSAYEECIRMLNGLERTLEQQLSPEQRRFNTEKTKAPQSPPPLNPEP